MALRSLLSSRSTASLGTRSQDYGLVTELCRAKDYNQGLSKKQQTFHQRNRCECFYLPASLLGNSKQALSTHSNSFTSNKKRGEEYMTSKIDLKGGFCPLFFFFNLSLSLRSFNSAAEAHTSDVGIKYSCNYYITAWQSKNKILLSTFKSV